MAVYGAPKRFNSVSVTLLLITLAIFYGLWRFFPAFWDSWTVDHELSEAVHAVYKLNRLHEPDRMKSLQELVNKTSCKICKIISSGGDTNPGLDCKNMIALPDCTAHPELTINLDFPDENTAVMTADYKVVITHPYLTKTTTLHFVKSEKTDIKRVVWE